MQQSIPAEQFSWKRSARKAAKALSKQFPNKWVVIAQREGWKRFFTRYPYWVCSFPLSKGLPEYAIATLYYNGKEANPRWQSVST